MQALIVCFFIIKDKERALGGGEPRQARAEENSLASE